jgi:tetratricopeptide (TPR) repeat protein
LRPSCFPYHPLIEACRSWGEDPNLQACLTGRRPEAFPAFVRLVLKSRAVEVCNRIGDFDAGLRAGQEALAASRTAGLPLGQAQALLLLSRCYGFRSEFVRMKETAEEALQIYTAYDHRKGQAEALNEIGYPCQMVGDLEAAEAHWEHARTLLEPLGEKNSLVICLCRLAVLRGNRGDYSRARENAERALSLAMEAGDLGGQAECYSVISNFRYMQGDMAGSLSCDERALALFQRVGDRMSQARTLQNIASSEVQMGNFPRALTCFAQAYEQSQVMGDRYAAGYILSNLGATHEALGEFEQAVSFQERALAIRRETGERGGQAASLLFLVSACLHLGDPIRAREALAEVQALAQAKELDEINLCHFSQRAAELAITDGDSGLAEREIESGLLLTEALGSRYRRAMLLLLRAGLKDKQGDWPCSQADWVESVTLLGSLGDKAELARAFYYFGKALLARGEEEKGRWYLGEARRIWEAIGAKGWLAKVEESS